MVIFRPALLIGAVLLIGAAPTVQTNVPKGYGLVWSDEFDGAGLPDTGRWRYDTEHNRKGWMNQEKQYYANARPENARLEDGHLVIEARAESLNPAQFPDWGQQKYTSARMISAGAGQWTYGFFEIRARLPCGVGTWPAIWMLPADTTVKWPTGGEIDIMEHVGFDPGVVHHSIHTKAFNFIRNSQKTTKVTVPDACTAMHRYQLLWTPELIVAGIDDKPNFLYRKAVDDPARWPFDKPQTLLLNIAVGGSWGGQQGIDKAAFPARMEIDYVRVYQPVKP